VRSIGTMLAMLLLASAARAGCLDEAAYGGVLERYASPAGVDYRGLRQAAEWQAVVESLAACQPEGMAFWINAYNILAMDLVVRHYPVESIRDIGSLLRPVWKREAGRIGGRGYSLDQIEDDMLRARGEPRIHAAIVCASISCPPLRREPYAQERLDTQLDDQMRRWLSDPARGARLEGGTLYLSSVFTWFAEDFGDVLAFVRPYLPFDPGPAPRIRYLGYDWGLNEAPLERVGNRLGRLIAS